MEEITWQGLATLPGAVAAVTLVLTILKAVLGIYWTEFVNRIAALALSVAVVVGVTAYFGNGEWPSYILAVFNGLIVAGALLGVTQVYNRKIVEDRALGFKPRFRDIFKRKPKEVTFAKKGK